MNMNRLLISLMLLFFTLSMDAQHCFSAFDAMFENGGDTLSAQQFKVREKQFLNGLVGCTPPDFTGTTLNDDELVLSGLKGKVVVLNFWFIHCLPCLKEIPLLNDLSDSYDQDEVVFIGLARDNATKLEAFFERFMKFKYQIIPESYLIADDYKVVGWPQSIVIDKNGKVYKVWAGAGESPQKLVNEIQQAIEVCIVNE